MCLYLYSLPPYPYPFTNPSAASLTPCTTPTLQPHRRISLRGGEVLVSDFEDQVDEVKNLVNSDLIDARTRAGKRGKDYIPVVFPDPEEENPCTGAAGAFLETNELRGFRDGGPLTCQEAADNNIPQTGGVSSYSVV